jgi:polysaccharide export outer membrane protein
MIAAGLLVTMNVAPAWSQGSSEATEAAPPPTVTSAPPPNTTAPPPGTTSATPAPPAAGAPVAAAAVAAPVLPAGYVIGPDDVLQIVFWREKELSGDVVVRPDGRISLPLLNDVVAAGRTPDELRATLLTEASKYFGNPNPTVVVKEIRSRKVFITGAVEKPGPYIVTSPTTVLQLISMAGGLKEYADKKNILVMRTTNGKQAGYVVDYSAILKRQNLEQNFLLEPGDTVLVR